MNRKKLITIGHSYVVALNRRMAHELTRNAPGNWEVTVCTPKSLPGDLQQIDFVRQESEPCETIPVKVRFSSQIHIMAYDRILRDTMAQKWDLIHAWEEPYIYSGFQIARWAKSSPLVYYTFQNIDKSFPIPFSWFDRYSMRKACGWIAAGDTTEQTLIKRPHYESRPRATIPLGVDVKHFYPNCDFRNATRQKLGWESENPCVVGYMGRFVPEKGLHILMQALDACTTPWRALFLGGGILAKEIEKWAERYPGRVAIVNGVNHDQVPMYLNAMDILVAPSQTTTSWREQLGRMLTESFACGIPVIASDSGEIPRVVGKAGVIVEEANVAAWTSAIESLLNNKVERARMSEAGLARAHSTFAWPIIAKQHWEFFLRVLDGE